MENTYSLSKRLEYSQVDWDYNYRLDWIFNDFQSITTFHSQQMGIDGPTMLEKSNAFWVLSKIKIQILSLPKMGDDIQLKTFPTTVTGARFMRDYTISNNGQKVILGTSEWCTLDATTGALRKTNSVCYPHQMQHVDYTSGCSPFSKPRVEITQDNYTHAHTIAYTDIDTNKHANNVSYVRMALNAFSPEELPLTKVSEMETYYISQAYYGQTIKIYKKEIEDGYYIEGKIEDKTIFSSIIKLKP
ncbi:MAG: hypothetical protein II988_01240 [Clostridia bacterium]|nr:hypothetical protein [Clostridia bacterium]